jgi:hypothetical protein
MTPPVNFRTADEFFSKIIIRIRSIAGYTYIITGFFLLLAYYIKAPFSYNVLKFNSHHINIAVNTWITKCRLIACMSIHIRSNLRDESIKTN